MPDRPGDADLEHQLEAWVASQSDAELSPDLERKIRDTLGSSLAPVKPLPSPSVLVPTFLAVFAASAAGLVAIMDKAGFRMMTGLQIALMTTILAVGGILFSFALAWRMVPASPQSLRFSLVLALPGCGLIAGIAVLFPWRTSGAFVSEGWPCAAMELMITIPAVAVFWLLARRGALFASAGLGAVLSGLGVFLALAPLQVQCMFQQAPHLLVWHVGTAVLLIGLGALIGELRHVRV